MNVATDGVELVIEAADEGEHEELVIDRHPEIAEAVGHTLQALAVLRDAEVPLLEVAELGIEEDDARLLVAKELHPDGEPGGAGRGTAVAVGHDDVGEVRGDAAVEPRTDNTVHAEPIGIGNSWRVVEDVILQ